MRNIIAVAVVLMVIAACKKEIEFKGEIGEPKLVVNCIMENDSTIVVDLSKSHPAIGVQTGSNDEITSGATLILVDETNGQSYTGAQIGSSNRYAFPVTAITGHKYTITVNHSTFGEVSSKTSLPQVVEIATLDTSSANFDEFSTWKTMELTINDPIGENYYCVAVLAVDTILQAEQTIYINATEGAGYDLETGEYLFFKDELFDGSQKKISFGFSSMHYYDENGIQLGEQSYRVKLFTLSKEAYLYLLSVTKSEESDNNPFAEPVRVYSNITNGLGVFGGVAKSEVLIE